ncbi:MAG TPA: hypothetical protein VGM18_14255 [Candidatus Sulfotelmatobacter sp.]
MSYILAGQTEVLNDDQEIYVVRDHIHVCDLGWGAKRGFGRGRNRSGPKFGSRFIDSRFIDSRFINSEFIRDGFLGDVWKSGYAANQPRNAPSRKRDSANRPTESEYARFHIPEWISELNVPGFNCAGCERTRFDRTRFWYTRFIPVNDQPKQPEYP